MNRTDLHLFYLHLAEMSEDASRSDRQRRGYDLEKIIHELLKMENLEPHMHCRPGGEEIDGSFLLGDRIYLLEAKWHHEPLSVAPIYIFKGKIEGKLDGTIGVFVSMSGFSEKAVEALGRGKTLNVILFDRNDIDACIRGELTFREVMRRKLRAAAEEGIAYLKLPQALTPVPHR